MGRPSLSISHAPRQRLLAPCSLSSLSFLFSSLVSGHATPAVHLIPPLQPSPVFLPLFRRSLSVGRCDASRTLSFSAPLSARACRAARLVWAALWPFRFLLPVRHQHARRSSGGLRPPTGAQVRRGSRPTTPVPRLLGGATTFLVLCRSPPRTLRPRWSRRFLYFCTSWSPTTPK